MTDEASKTLENQRRSKATFEYLKRYRFYVHNFVIVYSSVLLCTKYLLLWELFGWNAIAAAATTEW